MERREFIAAAGTAVVAASGGSVFAQTPGQMGEMHPPKYKALEEAAGKCAASGEDCLRHCLGMISMKDTNMAACTSAVVDLIAVTSALQTLASVNSTFTPAFAKDVAPVCDACRKETLKFADVPEAKACGDACKDCADECRKLA